MAFLVIWSLLFCFCVRQKSCQLVLLQEEFWDPWGIVTTVGCSYPQQTARRALSHIRHLAY